MASYEEYVDYLQRNVSWLEQLGDSLSGSDERLDYAVKQLLAIHPAIESLTVLLHELKEVGYIMPTMTQQVAFEYTLAPNQGVRLEELTPLDGEIISVGFHWPIGCNALVEIAVGHSYKQFMPISGFLALNDASPVFPTHEIVKREETVWCIMNNHDGFLQHHVSATVTMAGN